ncbi:MAG: auxin-responsive promoter [Phycisphaerales bacterium]|nr:auxin-responsive promoter [Phycisphaerales bacterium]
MKAALANAAWCLASAPSCAAFARALHDPARAQEAILRRYLAANADTAFGREHGFADIRTPDQFARRIPPRDYDELRPWIERIRRGEPRVLTVAPVRRLVPTSGSTAARKLIPYTDEMQQELNHAIGPWIVDLYRQRPLALVGPAYWSVTPLAEDSNTVAPDSTIPIGFDDDAAYLGGWRKHLVDAAMAVPAGLQNIRAIDAWRYLTLLFLLRRRDLSVISVWHPSFLELLLRALKDEWPRLLIDIAVGGCAVRAHVPAALATAAQGRPNPRRAKELEHLGPDAARIWPGLAILSCWADAGAEAAAHALAQRLPGVTIQPKGLIATEGVISIPYRGQHPLAIRSHFFEFEDEAGRVSLAPDLKPGSTYQVLLTTAGGLCRYRLHDLIRVDGHVARTPSIRFVGKAGLISDRMGEKLTEGFVVDVLSRLFAKWPFRPTFAMLAPDLDADGCRYTLYTDADARPGLATALDALLAANPQYAYCRRLGQLRPPRIFRLTDDPYVAYCLRLQTTGQRLGDIKPAVLSRLDDWPSHFAGRDAES